MVSIFVFTWLFNAYLARAARQGVDLQDVASTHLRIRFTGEDGHNAKDAQVTVQKKHVVLGHTSLNTVKVYGVQAVNGVCSDVIKKVSDLAKEELAISSTAGRSVDVDIDKTFLRDRYKRGQRELSKAFEVLDQSDLRDVMQTGEIWTLEDQDALIKCEIDKSVRIEEETRTATGEELVQGDMLVPSEESGSLLQLDTVIVEGARWAGQIWPSDGMGETYIFYCFDPDLEEGAKIAFHAAIEHTSAQIPCLRFVDVAYNDGVPLTNLPLGMPSTTAKGENFKVGQPGSCSFVPSIKVQDKDRDRCWSPVGMRSSPFSEGRSQPLNLGYLCQTMAIAAHELGHALGMVHEQSRPDRDSFITVHWDNIPTDQQNNFLIQGEGWQSDIYDPLSLMHYGREAFADDTTRPTITGNNPKITALLGQRQGWSEQDVLELAGKYCYAEVPMIKPKLGRPTLNKRIKVHKAQPAIRQKAMLERLIGHFEPVAKFSQLIVPSEHTQFCLKFKLCDGGNPGKTYPRVWGCGGLCRWCRIDNKCQKKVAISCPHEDPKQPMILDIGGSISYKDHLMVGSKHVNEAWRELEQGLCGVYVES